MLKLVHFQSLQRDGLGFQIVLFIYLFSTDKSYLGMNMIAAVLGIQLLPSVVYQENKFDVRQ